MIKKMQKKDAVNKKGDNKHNICTIKFENVRKINLIELINN